MLVDQRERLSQWTSVFILYVASMLNVLSSIFHHANEINLSRMSLGNNEINVSLTEQWNELFYPLKPTQWSIIDFFFPYLYFNSGLSTAQWYLRSTLKIRFWRAMKMIEFFALPRLHLTERLIGHVSSIITCVCV